MPVAGREAATLEWTAEGPTDIVEGRTRGDVRRLLIKGGDDIAFRMETQKMANFLDTLRWDVY